MTTLEFFAQKIESLLLPQLENVRQTGDYKWEAPQCPSCKAASVTLSVTPAGRPDFVCDSGCGYAGICYGCGVTTSKFEEGVEFATTPAHLLNHHLEQLKASGLTEEYIRETGVYSETNKAKVHQLLNSKALKAAACSGMVFPYLALDGKQSGYATFKSDLPRESKKSGKPIKYEAPTGMPRRVFFPPRSIAKFADKETTIWITEGEKKALCLDMHGLCVAGLGGVDCFTKKDHQQLSRDLERLDYSGGRKVIIGFDSDRKDNPKVLAAESKLAAMLQARGAVVKCLELPPGPNGEKVGCDDFVFASGFGALCELAEQAVDPEPIDGGVEKVNARDLDQIPTVQDFLKDRFSIQRDGQIVPTLRYWREDWFIWNKPRGCYELVSDWFVRTAMMRFLEPFACHVTQRATGDLMHALKGAVYVRDSLEMPGWLNVTTENIPEFPAGEYIALKNGLLHLPSLLKGDEHMIDHTPDYWSTNALSVSYEAESPEPANWTAFLKSVWPNDQQSIDTLAEIVGYLISGENRLQKMFMLVGPPRSGKGTIGRTITNIVGEVNVISPSLISLADTFGLQPMLGKTVCLISDAHLSGRADQASIVEVLKSISGEDTRTIHRKNRESVTTKLQVRFVLMSNELPRLADSSGALGSRLVMLTMRESFLNREDLELDNKLRPELDSIFLWAIQGLQRLKQRGHFVQPDTGKEMADEMKALSSPLTEFINACCVVGPDEIVRKLDLFDVYRAWSELRGNDHPGDSAMFGKNLRAVMPGVRDSQPRQGTKRIESYAGIGLITPATTALQHYRVVQAAGGLQRFSNILRQAIDLQDSAAAADTPESINHQSNGSSGNPFQNILTGLEFNKNRAREEGGEERRESAIDSSECNGAAVPATVATEPAPVVSHYRDDCHDASNGWVHPSGVTYCMTCWPRANPANAEGAAA